MPDLILPGFLLAAAVLVIYFIVTPERGLLARLKRFRSRLHKVLLEDSLKHLQTCESEGRVPSLESLAGALGIGAGRAFTLVEELRRRDLVVLDGGALRLTAAGTAYALRIVRAHRLWERHLADHTGYAETEWHRRADREEHRLAHEGVGALASRLGNPSHDPHGDPIPTASGELASRLDVPLAVLEAGQVARISHIEDEPQEAYEQIVSAGLHPGMQVRMVEKSAQALRFRANGAEHALTPLLAQNLSVTREAPGRLPSGRPLSSLRGGESARVVSLGAALRGMERRRLMDLGLLPGTNITAELRSPSGDLGAYLVRGALLALRDDQARHILVEPQGLNS